MSSMTAADLAARTRKLLEECHPDDPNVDRATFRGAQFDHGLAWVHFPEGLGGFGLTPGLQRAVEDEIRAGAERVVALGAEAVQVDDLARRQGKLAGTTW